jgi:hypothetical protein
MIASVFPKMIQQMKLLAVMCGLVFALAACGGSVVPPVVLQPPASPPEKNVQSDTDGQTESPLSVVDKADTEKQTIKVAILLPLSGPESSTGIALLRAATMALFDAYDPRVKLLPFDTQADADIAAFKAQEAIEAGASVVIGPLLADSVAAAGAVLEPAGITLIGFSNDRLVATKGRFIMGFLPQGEVKRVIDYAVEAGYSRFAALVSDGRYGSRVRAAFGSAVVDADRTITAIETYPPDAGALFEPVKRLARYDERRNETRQEIRALRALRDEMTDEIAKALEDKEVMEGVDFDAVLVPEGGALMRTLAPLLPFYEIDPNQVKLLGTGLWNDPGLLGEPQLQGALFAAPEPALPNGFLDRYVQTYGAAPPRIVTLAYDAMSLVSLLARSPLEPDEQQEFDEQARGSIVPDEHNMKLLFAPDRIITPEGFSGLDGLFRFTADGVVERSLAILEVNRQGLKVVDPAPTSFPVFGYTLAE